MKNLKRREAMRKAALAIAVFGLTATPLLAFGQQTFIPLTDIPGFPEAGSEPDIGAFLNALYRICVGIAAVLAVLQIVRAGVMYTMGDSITEKKEARNLIALSIFGLLLVLSPAIVFGVIDPRILSLQIDTGDLTVPPGEMPADHEHLTCTDENYRFPIGFPLTPLNDDVPGNCMTSARCDAQEGCSVEAMSDEYGSPQNFCRCESRVTDGEDGLRLKPDDGSYQLPPNTYVKAVITSVTTTRCWMVNMSSHQNEANCRSSLATWERQESLYPDRVNIVAACVLSASGTISIPLASIPEPRCGNPYYQAAQVY